MDANPLITNRDLSCLLRDFSFIFRYKVCSVTRGHVKKLEILPRLHFEREKVLNGRMKLEITKRRHLENSVLRRDWH